MAWYEDDLTALAFCWRVQRADGEAIGITSHDRDLAFDGLIHTASPGMVPSAIERRDDFQSDTVSIDGALTSGLITEADLEAGKWDGARLRLTAVNWQAPDIEPVVLVEGELGGVESDGRNFSAELLGAASILDRPVVEETSPECRAQLGDKRCRVDMAGRIFLRQVMATDGASITLDSLPGADGDFDWGRLRWLDGPNAGLSAAIAGSSGAIIELREPPPFAPSAGAMVELSEGCDRRFATCCTRFANALNFRGEPHLPGNDLLVRYAR